MVTKRINVGNGVTISTGDSFIKQLIDKRTRRVELDDLIDVYNTPAEIRALRFDKDGDSMATSIAICFAAIRDMVWIDTPIAKDEVGRWICPENSAIRMTEWGFLERDGITVMEFRLFVDAFADLFGYQRCFSWTYHNDPPKITEEGVFFLEPDFKYNPDTMMIKRAPKEPDYDEIYGVEAQYLTNAEKAVLEHLNDRRDKYNMKFMEQLNRDIKAGVYAEILKNVH